MSADNGGGSNVGAVRDEGGAPQVRTHLQGSEGAALAGSERGGAHDVGTHAGRPRAREDGRAAVTSQPPPSNPEAGSDPVGCDSQSDSDGPEGAVRSRAERGPDGSAGLPCQNRNNSDKPAKRYSLKPVPGIPGCFTAKGDERGIWKQLDGDTIERWGFHTGAEAKAAFHLRKNVEAFVRYWGRNRCLFFTITDKDNLHPTVFARRWNHYLRRHGEWIVSFIRVLEPQKQGRPHYHVLVAVAWDTRPDSFDWEAFDGCQQELKANGRSGRFRELRSRYRASAAPELVMMWGLHRKVLPRYGLGDRAELLPLRKGEGAISEYIGKYLQGGLVLRRHSWKGCRRVEFDRRAKDAWLACSRVFAWHSPGAKAWRKRVGEIGVALGALDLDGIRRRLGPKWAYRLRDAITLANEVDWALVLGALAGEFKPAA